MPLTTPTPVCTQPQTLASEIQRARGKIGSIKEILMGGDENTPRETSRYAIDMLVSDMEEINQNLETILESLKRLK